VFGAVRAVKVARGSQLDVQISKSVLHESILVDLPSSVNVNCKRAKPRWLWLIASAGRASYPTTALKEPGALLF